MIRLKYEPSFREYRFLNHHVMRWVFRGLIAIVGLLICLTIALPLALRVTGHSQPINYGALVMALLPICGAVGLIYLAFEIGIRRRWKNAEELRVDREYELTEEGIRTRSASLEGFYQWKHIKHADLGKGFVFLKTAQNQYFYFPLAAAPDTNALLQLVARNARVSKRWQEAVDEKIGRSGA